MGLDDVQKPVDEERHDREPGTAESSGLVHKGGLHAPTSSKLSIFQHFTIFRNYVDHEDDLINNRLLWNINIQGFLFATYGFSLQKLAEVQMKQGTEIATTKALYWLVGTLPIFGIIMSVTSYKGVQAAQIAITNLNQQWKEIVEIHYRADDLMVPKLIGGGCPAADQSGAQSQKAHDWGFRAPKWFPWICAAAWALLFLSYVSFLIYYFFGFGRP